MRIIYVGDKELVYYLTVIVSSFLLENLSLDRSLASVDIFVFVRFNCEV